MPASSSRRRTWAIVGAAGAVALLAWIAIRGPAATDVSLSEPQGSETAEELSTSSSTSVQPAPQTQEPDTGALPSTTPIDEGQRQAAQTERFPLQLLVQDEMGQPIGDATVSWTELGESSAGQADGDEVERILSLVESSRWATSDGEGRARFTEAPGSASPGDSVVWVSHPRFRAAALLIEGGTGALGKILNCSLQPALALRAQVVVEGGAAADGLRILQAGLGRDGLRVLDARSAWLGHGEREAMPSDDALRCFVRSYDCDKEARVGIARGVIPTQLIAIAEGQRSGPRTTKSADKFIELQLAPELRAEGTINHSAADSMPEDARVVCRWKADLDVQVLGEFPVAQSGKWGPSLIPRRGRGEYIFRLMGGDFIPEEKVVSASSVGTIIEVDLDGVFGRTQSIAVQNTAGEKVSGALVEATWPIESGWQRSRGWTGSDGIALLPGCPQTTAVIRITKAGYVSVSQDDNSIVADNIDVFTLKPAGVVEGRVTQDGDPVQDFQVFTWDVSPFARVVHTFVNRQEGEFVLDGLNLGPVSILASSPEYPEGEALTLEVVAGERAKVEFELPLGCQGEGRVVDGVTGQPIEGATVELLSQFSGRTLGGRGAVVSVQSDGRFKLDGVRLEIPLIRARAPGRIQVDSTGTLQSDGHVTFGTIPLPSRQELLVRVHSPVPLEEWSTWFGSSSTFAIPFEAVPVNGELIVPGVAPGYHMMKLMFYDGTLITQSVFLKPGTDWLVEFDHDLGATLDVLVVLGDEPPLPPNSGLSVVFRIASGATTIHIAPIVDVDVPVRLRHVPSGEVLLFVAGDGGYLDRLGSKKLLVGPDRSEVIELHLGGRTLEVTAVDQHGLNLDQGIVLLDSAVPGALFHEGASMPADRPFSLGAIPVDELIVTVHHPSRGLGILRVRMKSDEPVTQALVQVGGAPMQVRVADGTQPVPGVEVRLIPAGVVTKGFLGKTDEQGLTTFLGIPDYHFSLSLNRYGYWPARHEIDFNGQDLLQVSLRQRGDLELTLAGPQGQPLAGQAISLISVEDGVSVQDWLDARLLEPDAAQLVSDAQGLCYVRGVPRGSYRWELVRPSGDQWSGNCAVPPGQLGEVSILVDE